jgi:hypothetical protein
MHTPSLNLRSKSLPYYLLHILAQEIIRLHAEHRQYNKEHQHHDVLTLKDEAQLLWHDRKDLVPHRHH